MIEVENFKKQFDDFSISLLLTIPSGRIAGLIGENGSGKSTLIKSILGLLEPDAGRVRVFGVEATHLTASDRQKMGVALSDSDFSGYLTITEIARILLGMYDKFEMGDFLSKCQEQKLPLNKPIRLLSTGMRAKLRVLIALFYDASLIILDEPTTGLDVEARK